VISIPGLFHYGSLPRSACSAAKSSTDNFTALPIVDHDERLFAFKADVGQIKTQCCCPTSAATPNPLTINIAVPP